MHRLTITDGVGDTVFSTVLDDSFDLAGKVRLADREARALVARYGRVGWRLVGADGLDAAAGEAMPEPRPGLLPTGTPVLYCEADTTEAPLAAYGTVLAVRGGCYVVGLDYLESGGRQVPIAAGTEIRVPLDTPPDGALHTLEAVPLAGQVAAE